jgi:hypothetical protein
MAGAHISYKVLDIHIIILNKTFLPSFHSLDLVDICVLTQDFTKKRQHPHKCFRFREGQQLTNWSKVLTRVITSDKSSSNPFFKLGVLNGDSSVCLLLFSLASQSKLNLPVFAMLFSVCGFFLSHIITSISNSYAATLYHYIIALHII